ncbi:MAG: efflux RND transporter permease subunit [Pseudomonadaceae bacterium]|uniref:efflux RND transporter permease subunit n=1 Tax=Pseudomonas sp. Ga0074129 TaxID=1752219 RepID=UPI000AB72A94|nr:efflux RND transporter permease subunit [Pseudomonas sp. Ga0074129]MBX9764414.1 efflux RND transporter permease subunit [Pseudomonadaceae bacterium]
MDIAGYFIQRRVTSWLVTLVLGIGGLMAFLGIGRLEDPSFTLKNAMVITSYPGASPQQVEEEVSYPLENAIQQLPSIKKITSISSAGLSQISLELHSQIKSEEIPQIWDELRRKINDLQPHLPPGVNPPQVRDDFSDVFGFFLLVTGKGYSAQELRDFADYLRRELVLLPGVGKVTLAGARQEQVQVEISRSKMSALGIAPQRLAQVLSQQNVVSNAGRILVGSESIRLHPTGEFQDVRELERLIISDPGSSQQVTLGDIAQVSRGFSETPGNLYRMNGQDALTLGIAFAPKVNVVDVGAAVNARLAELDNQRPAGMQLQVFYDQAAEVDSSVQGFVINFVASVVIVIVVLLVFMGMRSGLLIGLILALTVLGSFIFMRMLGIELQRISLGALVIALGMLVDNAIVVVEGILVGRQRGQTTLQAARAIVKQTNLPLLGATLIAIIAFAPIGLSDDSTGEFCLSLFQVLMISLLLSWVTAITLTPFFASLFFRDNQTLTGQSQGDPYGGVIFTAYRALLDFALHHRRLTLGLLSVLLVVAIAGFGNVRQSFFPPSNTPMFFIDLWLPQGTDIRYTEQLVAELDQHVLEQEGVTAVSSTIGQGALRFILTYSPQKQYPNYAQLLVRTDELARIEPLINQLEQHVAEQYPQIKPKFKQLMLGPGNDSKIEARFSGPDPEVLRQLGSEAIRRMRQDPVANAVTHDWHERTKLIRPQFAEARARELGVDKSELDDLLRMSFSGMTVGLYREGTQLLPIIARTPDNERLNADSLNDLQVWSNARGGYLPIEQVLLGFTTEWEDPLIMRLNRKRTLTVQADPALLSGETAAQLFGRIRPEIEAIPLPEGYSLEWGGEYESSRDAQSAVFGSLPLGFLAMFMITILLFDSFKRATVIWLTVPLAMIGVTLGFLITGIPFGFMALLGLLSLSGMLVKNGIVLVDEIQLQLASGKDALQAVEEASISRVRPVSMAALTTILGMSPLLADAFFQSMAVVIMFGLGFATLLTLVVLPVLYCMFYGIGKPDAATASA